MSEEKCETGQERGWLWLSHSEIAEINPPKPSLNDSTVVSFLPMGAVEAETGEASPTVERYFSEVKKGYTAFRNGDILFAKITPCMENGKVALVGGLKNGLGFGSSEFHVSRLHHELDARFYLYYFLSHSFRKEAQGNMTGSAGQLRVPTNYFREVDVPLPPVNEQRRIVAKIEELFSELDNGVESLKTARAKLKTYRQSLLKAAFEGRLTERWFSDNTDEIETADEFLQRIRAVREADDEEQLKDQKEEVGQQSQDGLKKRKLPRQSRYESGLNEYTKIIEEQPDLPVSWSWVKLGWVLSRKPQNGRSVKSKAGGFPVLTLTALHGTALDLSQCKEGDWGFDDARPYVVKEGDFLIARGNGSKSLVGRGARAVRVEKKVAYPDTMIRLSPDERWMQTRFLSLLWESRIVRNQIESSARTTAGIYKINQQHINELLVPLPHNIEEQEYIADSLETGLSACDYTEELIERGLKRAETLHQSILKRAFEGKLVPQGPDDEPASVLLERIRAEQEKEPRSAKGRRKANG